MITLNVKMNIPENSAERTVENENFAMAMFFGNVLRTEEGLSTRDLWQRWTALSLKQRNAWRKLAFDIRAPLGLVANS